MFSLLRHFSIKVQLLLLVSIPVIALICFVIFQLSSTMTYISQTEILKEQIQISDKLSLLVHELQKERGMSAGFMASKGNKFKSELQAQRQLTNKAHKELAQMVKNGDDLPKVYLTQINNGLESVSKINDIRKQIDSSINMSENIAPKMINYYTSVISFLLNSVLESTKLIDNAILAKSMVAYANFLYAKESAGLERATANGIFANNGIPSDTQYNKFVSLIAEQDVYIKLSLALASQESINFYQNAIKDPSFAKVQEMRDILDSKRHTGNFGIDATLWFDTITKKD